MSATEEHSIRFGPHTARINGDLLYVVYDGDFLFDHAKLLLDFVHEHFGSAPYYAICDLTNMGTTSPEARRLLTDWTRDKQLCAGAMIGGNIVARVLTMLVNSAIRVVGKKNIPVCFVRDMQEAQTWIAQQRRQRSDP